MEKFPNHNIDPARKNRKWILQMAKAIWEEWTNIQAYSFAHGADKYRTNRLYSNGKQGYERYKEKFQTKDDPDTSYMNIDWSVIPIIPKFRRIAIEKVSSIDSNISAQAIDPLALSERKQYELREKANIALRNELGAAGIDSSILDSGEPDQPQDNEELSMKMDFVYKHNMAIDIEKRIEAVFHRNHIEELRTKVRRDLFDYGASGYKDYFDPVSGEVKVRTIDAPNLIMSPTKDEYCRDSVWIGEYTYMTIEDIRRSARGEIDEEQLEAIAEKYSGKYGNPSVYGDSSPYNKAYDSARVPVVDMEFQSVNSEVYEKRIDSRGNKIVGRTKFDNYTKKRKGRETFRDDMIVWYRYKWVLDTDFLFEYGLVPDMPRKNSKIWDAQSSYHIVAPDLYDMETLSMVDHLRPLVDEIMYAWYKLQNVIMTARPKGIMIEIGALEGISMGEGGGEGEEGTVKPMQLIDMLNQSGTLVYRKIDYAGNMVNYKPIEELQNGIGEEATQWFSIIQNYFSMIRDMLGFNDFTDGSTPDPRSLNGVASLAASSTDNALFHLLRAEINLLERLADSVAVRIHDAIAFKDTKVYDNIIGAESIKSIREDKNSIHREYGIVVEIQSDRAARERFEVEELGAAIQAGQITIAEKIAIKSIRNLKQASQYLAYKIKKREEQMQAIKQSDIQTNAQVQQQSAAEAHKMKLEEIQADAEAKAMIERVKGEEDRKTVAAQGKSDRQHLTTDRSMPVAPTVPLDKPQPAAS